MLPCLLLNRSSPSQPCWWLGRMWSCPWRVSAAPISVFFRLTSLYTIHLMNVVSSLYPGWLEHRSPFWRCGPKDRSPDIASFLSPTCVLCVLADFCCGYLLSWICIRHSMLLLRGNGADLCGPGSNGWEVSFSQYLFDRSRLDLSGDCSSSIPLTHFHPFHRWIRYPW